MRRGLVLTLLAAASAWGATPDHKAFWLDLGGKGEDSFFTVADTWPLSRFATHMPYWVPGQAANRLQWRPLDKLASVVRLPPVDGIRTYQVAYSPAYHVVVADRGGWAFAPAAIVSGDESIVSGVHTGRVFQWDGRHLLHVRVQLQGTGHFQVSLFFAAVDGQLVYLQADAEDSRSRIDEFYARNHIRPYHRGLGYCEGTLVHEGLFEVEGSDGPPLACRNCRVVLRQRVEGARLVVDSIGFQEASNCVIFP